MVDSKKTTTSRLGVLEKTYIGILSVIFGGIVLHAPFIVGFGTLFPDYDLVLKSWKEILMGVAAIIAVFLLYKNKRLNLLKNPLVIAIAAYGALHLALIPLFYSEATPVLAGLLIDLRYLLFFVLVLVAIHLYPEYRKLFIKVGIAGALVVLVFALLQVFILPHDILKYIGYNINTIVPYLTVDQNHDFIRISSTLRGPNPLGAYAGVVLALIVAALAKHKVRKERWPLTIVTILSAGGVVALWASYSRSALVAALVAIVIVLAITAARRLSTRAWVIGLGILIVLAGALFIAKDSHFISNVLLHEDPVGGSTISSNEGHVESLKDGLARMIYQPLGAGIGSTGSASLLGDEAVIIENQYLFTAHETGWLGLVLFISIFVSILVKLWQKRRDWLALGVLASGVGLALIGLLLPVWVDDTIAIIWWGLAAIALGSTAKVSDL